MADKERDARIFSLERASNCCKQVFYMSNAFKQEFGDAAKSELERTRQILKERIEELGGYIK